MQQFCHKELEKLLKLQYSHKVQKLMKQKKPVLIMWVWMIWQKKLKAV